MKRYRCKFSMVSFYVTTTDGTQQLVEFKNSTNRKQGSTIVVKDEALQQAIEGSQFYRCGIVSIVPQEDIARDAAGRAVAPINTTKQDELVAKVESMEGVDEGEKPARDANLKVVFDEPYIPAEVLKKHRGDSKSKPVPMDLNA